jgi:hypothetical protein
MRILSRTHPCLQLRVTNKLAVFLLSATQRLNQRDFIR